MEELNLVEVFKKRVRSPFRARASDVVENLFPEFNYFSVPKDGSLLAGSCQFLGKNLLVIAQQKPKIADMKKKKGPKRLNYGMLTSDDHSFILSILENIPYSERENTYVFSIVDTYGADISMYSAERFQAFFIAQSIQKYLTVPVRTVSLVLGEGGSGGALAIQCADIRGQMSDAFYTTAAPESTATILFRDPKKISDAISILRPTAAELEQLGIIERVVQAPDNPADVVKTSENVRQFLTNAITDISGVEIETLVEKRKQIARNCGLIKKDITYDDKYRPEFSVQQNFRELPPNIGELRDARD